MRMRFWLGFALVVAIAAASVAGGLFVHQREVDSFERSQRDAALRAARQAEAVAALSVGQLESAAAFYAIEEEVASHEFDVIADSLLRTGALVGTAFVEAVPRGERAEYERLRGVPIVERAALGDLTEAAPRRSHFPIAFARSKVELALGTPRGYDLGSDPIRHPYMLKARDSGRPTATRVIRLLAGGTGINVFHPVYADRARTGTPSQRRSALIGFAVGAFRVPDLAAAATATLPSDVDAQLLEGDRPVAGEPLPHEEAATAAIEIADRTWVLLVRDPNRPAVALPLLMAVLGISLAALLGALVLVWSRNERMQELRRQAGHDPLTGLRNRRRFEEDLRAELARSRRDASGGALLMLDIDDFKRVNDTLGHPAGDRAIAGIAGILQARMRLTDAVARLGGDEFAIVLPRCELDEAEDIADAIGREIRQHKPPAEEVDPITVSIGVATFGQGTADEGAVLSAADHALYEAKRAGRDTVRVATGPAPARHKKTAEPRI